MRHSKRILTTGTIIAVLLSGCGGGSNSPSSAPTAGGGPTSPAPPPTSPGGPAVGAIVAVDSLSVGSCIAPIGDDTDVEFIRVLDCDSPHPYQVAGQVLRAEGASAAFPGDRELERTAHQDCRDSYAAYVGIPYSGEEFAIDTIVPSRGSWRDGDRAITCLVTGLGGSDLTRSVEGG